MQNIHYMSWKSWRRSEWRMISKIIMSAVWGCCAQVMLRMNTGQPLSRGDIPKTLCISWETCWKEFPIDICKIIKLVRHLILDFAALRLLRIIWNNCVVLGNCMWKNVWWEAKKFFSPGEKLFVVFSFVIYLWFIISSRVGRLAQLARAPHWHCGGHWFKSSIDQFLLHYFSMAVDTWEDTRKWPNDFPDKKSFFSYCAEVAHFIYFVLTWKRIDDK